MDVGLKDRVLQLHFNVDLIPFFSVETQLCYIEIVQNADFISINGYSNLLSIQNMRKPSNSRENIKIIPNIRKNKNN